MVQKIDTDASGEKDFLPLKPSDILFTASVNLKLEYAFYTLRKRF